MTRSRPESDSFQTRSVNLLRPAATDGRSRSPSINRPSSRITAASNGGSFNEKDHAGPSQDAPPTSSPSSSNEKTLTTSKDDAIAEDKDKQRLVRALPPWVHSATQDDDDHDPTKRLLPRHPGLARPPQHNYLPAPKKGAYPGRAYDYKREREPPFIKKPIAEDAPRWRAYMDASGYPPPFSKKGEVVGEEWMNQNMPDLEGPWAPGIHQEEKKRKKWSRRVQLTVLKSPFVPLVVRVIVLTFSTLALGLSGSIWHRSNITNAPGTGEKDVGCNQQASSLLAICFNSLAIVYTFYITYDEYTSKPLGLRSPGAKMRLIFLDLFFIVFDAATVSLAFNTLTDVRWACYDDQVEQTCPQSEQLCGRQAALVSILLVALLAWLLTFSISTLRLINRVAHATLTD